MNVTLEIDELDVTVAESKATYEEIKEYVLEKHGLQVTNLYVAQVKRKCGVIERENYNKPKSEDAKQPQCPEEKEKAIRDVLSILGWCRNLEGVIRLNIKERVSMKDYEKIGDHTIKKFELVSEYTKGWAHKILGYKESTGLVYIDCMCNCGMYYDSDGETVEGTAIRVAKTINQINSMHQKEAILYFNDIDEEKIQHLKSVIDALELKFVQIHYYNTDANQLLRKIANMEHSKHNTLLFYDPYQANIDWEALEPFFNIWGEVIINHMVSDVIRGAKSVSDPIKIAKYEKTYHKSIDEIIRTSNLQNNREEFEKITNSIIKSCVYTNGKKYYIASFPFYIKTNQLIYNLVYFSWNIKGMSLFKKTAWDTFGGQSSIKHAIASETPGQMCLDFDTGNLKEDVRPGIYTVYDIAKYIYGKYKDKGEVAWDQIYVDIEQHPIFPCDGYKTEIKNTLKDSFGTINKRSSVIFENRGIL